MDIIEKRTKAKT